MQSYRLSDIVKIKNGKDHKMLSNGKYPVLGSGGIMRYVDNFLYDKPSVLLPRKGTLDNIQYCDVPFWTVDTLYYTEVNTELANPYYLYRYLSLLDLSNLDSGTGVPSMTFDNYYGLKIFLPSIEKQTKIARVLQTLDKKIAVNRQINQNLEAMAKQLYDYWFVQFDFPNEEGKPYKSSGGEMVWNEKLKREIPKGWEIRPLNSLITVKDGTHESPKQQLEGRYLITSKHLLSSGIDYNTAYYISEEDYIAINKRSQVETNDILFSMIGTIGNKYLVAEKNVNFAIKNMALLKTSKSMHIMYFLWLYLSSWDYKHYEFNAISGSIQKFLSLDAMRNIPVPFNYDIAVAFNKQISNICQCIINLKEENIQLIKQRNELLPLLMNGQVSVNSDLSYD